MALLSAAILSGAAVGQTGSAGTGAADASATANANANAHAAVQGQGQGQGQVMAVQGQAVISQEALGWLLNPPALFRQLDVDSDGLLNYNEFSRISVLSSQGGVVTGGGVVNGGASVQGGTNPNPNATAVPANNGSFAVPPWRQAPPPWRSPTPTGGGGTAVPRQQ